MLSAILKKIGAARRSTPSGRAMQDSNHLGQPVGVVVPDWRPPPPPSSQRLEGRLCRLERLDVSHTAALHAAYSLDRDGKNWTYLPYGPFPTFESFAAWLEPKCDSADPLFYAIIDRAAQQAVGVASYMRIDCSNGSIEVGHINFSPLLQSKPAATEAMFLMMKHVFDLGYRRYEWKCNALNVASRQAAQRLGFSFEGIFRQAAVHKGRSRDTAWYAVIDKEWPALREIFEQWLHVDNFDAQGRQRTRLSDLTQSMRARPG